MKIFLSILLICLFASVPAAASGFQIDYHLNLRSGTLNGNDVTSVMILESGGPGLVNLDFPFTIPGVGGSVLSHMAPFVPTSSLIVGIDLPSTTGGDQKSHLVFFTNSDFAYGADGVLFSKAFPNTRHNDFTNRLLAAQGGDAAQIDWLKDFFLTGDGLAAAFETGTSPVAVEFTVGTVLPEPQTYALMAVGLIGMLVRLRRRS